MYTKDGEKLLHRRRAHRAVGRPPGEPAQHPRQAVHRLLLRLPPQPVAGERAVAVRGVPVPGRRAADAGHLRGRVRRPRDLPAGAARRVLLQRLRSDRGGVRPHPGPPGQADLQPLLRPAQRRGRPRPAAGRRRALRAQGREALHRRVARRVPRLEARTTRGPTATSRCAASSASRTSTSTRARPSGRSTGTRSTSPTSTTSPPTSPTSTSSSSTADCPGSRTSAGSPPRNPTCTAVWPWRCRSCTPGRATSPRSSASCCTGSARTGSCSPATTRSGRRGGWSSSSSTSRSPTDMTEYPAITTEQKKKILGLNAAKLYDIEVPAELRLPDADEPAVGPRGADDTANRAPDRGGRLMTVVQVAGVEELRARAYEALSVVGRPGAGRADHRPGLRPRLSVDSGVGGLSVALDLRLPTSFCSPNFAYLMCSDAKDALSALGWTARGRGRARRPPRLRADQRRTGGGCGLSRHLRSRGRAGSGRAPGDLPAQGPHGGDGALPDRTAPEPNRSARSRAWPR